MRKYVLVAAIVAAALPVSPAMARQMNGYTVRWTTMRAGPDDNYPMVQRLRSNAAVIVYGCLSDRSWCDVSYRYDRGWISGDDIVVNYQGQRRRIMPAMGIGVLSFVFGSYWDSHYRSRPFYSERPRWEQHYNSYHPQRRPGPHAPSLAPQRRHPDVGVQHGVTPQRPAIPGRQAAPSVPMVTPQWRHLDTIQRGNAPSQRQAVPDRHAQPNRQAAPGNFNRGESRAPGQQRGGQVGRAQGRPDKDQKSGD